MKKFILPFVVIMAMMLSSCGITNLAFRYQEMKENEAKAKASTKTTVPPTIDGPNILNICYNADYPDDCKMDIYRDNTTDKNRAVVMIHGGVWLKNIQQLNNTDRSSIAQDKDFFLNIKNDDPNAAHKGFHVVNIEYRRIAVGQSTHTFRDMIDDIRTAIQYIQAHGEEYNIRPDLIVMYGYSSGAHLAELFSYKWTTAQGIASIYPFSPIKVGLCIAKSGISDFANAEFHECDVFGFTSDDSLKEELVRICREGGIASSEQEIAPYIRSYLFTTLLGIKANSNEIDVKKIATDNKNMVNKASPLYYVNQINKQNLPLQARLSSVTEAILLHGEQDTFAPISMAEDLNTALGTGFCKLFTMPNAGHELKHEDASDDAVYKEFEAYVTEKLIAITNDTTEHLSASHTDVTFD